jgi:hypothetical protein
MKKKFKKGSSFETAYLNSGDIIYIPPKGIAKVEAFCQSLDTILSPILNLERGLILWPSLVDAIEDNNDESSVIVAP